MKKSQQPPHVSRPQEDSRYKWLFPVFALLVAVGVVYLPMVSSEFVNFDDPDYVYDNAQVTTGMSWDGLVYAFTTNDMANWHPITWLSLMMDAQLYGDWPGGFHLTSVLLHAGGVVAYYFALISLFKVRTFAFLASLVYAIHPLHVESVTWISERKGILSSLFWMLALLAYAYYIKKPNRRRMLLVASALTFGLMSKQMLITLPIALLLLDYWPLKRELHLLDLLREKSILFAICSIFAVIAYIAQKSGGAVVSLESTPLAERSSNALIAFNGYLLKFAIPMGLYIPRISPQTSHPTWLVILSFIAIAGMFAVAIQSRRGFSHITVGFLWYLCTILPVIGIVPIGIQWMADRYTDIPMIGISWAILWPLAPQLSVDSSARKVSVLAISLVVACLVYFSALQVMVWKNTESLFTNTLRYDPDNELAHLHLGTMYMATNDFSQAESSLQGLITGERVSPIVRSMAANNLINMLTTQGKPSEAAVLLCNLKDFDYPAYEATVVDLVNSLQSQGNREAAYRVVDVAINASPQSAGLRVTFGTLLLSVGRIADAKAQFLLVTKLDANLAVGFYNLGLAEVGLGNYRKGIVAYQKAIAIDPSRPEFYNNLAVAYAAIGNSNEAIDNYRKAISLKYEYAVAHYNLACILLAEEVTDEAMFHFNQSLTLSGPNKVVAAAAQEKLKLLQTQE